MVVEFANRAKLLALNDNPEDVVVRKHHLTESLESLNHHRELLGEEPSELSSASGHASIPTGPKRV